MKKPPARVDFGEQVIVTSRFLRTWENLPPRKRQVVVAKITLLTTDPRYPSLNVHRLHRAGKEIFECYVSCNTRLLYQYQEEKIVLWEVGGHAIVDRAHLRGFSAA